MQKFNKGRNLVLGKYCNGNISLRGKLTAGIFPSGKISTQRNFFPLNFSAAKFLRSKIFQAAIYLRIRISIWLIYLRRRNFPQIYFCKKISSWSYIFICSLTYLYPIYSSFGVQFIGTFHNNKSY